jgi:hypothetical protein
MRLIGLAVVLSVILTPFAAEAQQAAKVYRIGLLGGSHPEQVREWLHAVVAEALHVAQNEIETEYRKLGTNLLQKELDATPKPKDGA